MYQGIKLTLTLMLANLFINGCTPVLKESQQLHTPLTYKILENYKWELIDAKNADKQIISQLFINPNKPLILNFILQNDAHLLALENTCNRYFSEYAIQNDNIHVNQMAGTLMACPEELANFDELSLNIINGKYRLVQKSGHPTILIVENDQYTAWFKAVK